MLKLKKQKESVWYVNSLYNTNAKRIFMWNKENPIKSFGM